MPYLGISNEVKQTVNARELHSFLESKQHFADWIKNRINDFGFMQDTDFIVHKIMNEKKQVVTADYFLSLDMAKELSMVERNEKGKQARQYFIECEKTVKQQLIPQTLPEALRLAVSRFLSPALVAICRNKKGPTFLQALFSCPQFEAGILRPSCPLN